jgi:hypothetical protein
VRHFDAADGATAAGAGLTGTAGAVGFTALTTGFTGGEVGFAGPPRVVGFTGAARGVCFLAPPIEFWAEARTQKSQPNAATIKTIASALFFMGPSPEVSTLTIVNADHEYAADTNDCPLLPPKLGSVLI